MSTDGNSLSRRVELPPGVGFGFRPGVRLARWLATFLLFALVSLPAAFAEAIEVPPFTSVSVKGAVEVAFERGDKHRVVIASGHGVLTRDDSGELRIEGAEGEQAQVSVALLEANASHKRLELELNGLTNDELGNLQANIAVIEAQGSLRGSVHATDELSLKLTGLGSIRYRGSPKLTPIVNGIADLARY